MRLVRTLAVWFALAVPTLGSAAPRDELLRLVPDDFTLCLVVQNLRDETKAFTDAGVLKKWLTSPALRALQQGEGKTFRAAIDRGLGELGVTLPQVRDDLVGDAFVAVYRKGPPDQPEREDGLILLHARDEQFLRRLVDRVNEIQRKAGEIKSVGSMTGGYFRRTKEDGSTEFYAIHGPTFLYSPNESSLRAALSKLGKGTDEPPVVGRMRKLGIESAPVAFLIGPRGFDTEFAAEAKRGKPSDQAFVQEFRKYWSAVENVGGFVNLRPYPEIGLAIQVRPGALPPAAAKFLADTDQRSPLWDRVPENALIAMAGRINTKAFVTTFREFLSPHDRGQVATGLGDALRPFLESDDLTTLMDGLGSDFGFWIAPPEAGDKTWVPRATLAVKTADGEAGERTAQAAVRGLTFLGQMAALSEKSIRVQRGRPNGLDIVSLQSPTAFPPGFQPSFATKDGHVVLASSPRLIEEFSVRKRPVEAVTDVPLVRVSVRGWREYLTAHREAVSEYLGKQKGNDPKAIGESIDAFLAASEGIDRIEVLQRPGPDRIAFVVRIKDVR